MGLWDFLIAGIFVLLANKLYLKNIRTMCDFLDFGLTFFSIMCIQVVARLPQRLKSTFFEIFSSLLWLRSKKFQKTLILAFEANSALSRKNETKIVKITHSAKVIIFDIWNIFER